MDPQALTQVAASQPEVIGLLFFLVIIVPIVLFVVGMFSYWAYEELKERVHALEKKKDSDSQEVMFTHLLNEVHTLRRNIGDLDEKFGYISQVTQRISESESQLTEKVGKITASQLDTSLVALLNDGIVKELSKESESNPPPTV